MITVSDISELIKIFLDDLIKDKKCELNLYEYLQNKKCRRMTVLEFINSNFFIALNHQVEEIEMYLSGTQNSFLVKDSYDWMGIEKINKIKNYLNNIIDDAKRYEQSKKPGRKPKSTNK